MAITIDPVSPLSNAVDVPVNSEVVIHIYDSVNPLDLSTLEVTIQDDKELHYAMRYGEFSDDWSGEIIVNSSTDVTVVLIRHAGDPLYPQGGNVYVSVAISATSYAYSFYTDVQNFAYPPAYDQKTDLTSLPLNWSTAGTAPTFWPAGMRTSAGNSYITRVFSGGTDFSGLLIDAVISVQTPYAVTKILEVVNNDLDIVSVYIDLSNNEMWIGDVNGIPASKFRPAIHGDTLEFRLSIKNVGEDLIARLYAKSPSISIESLVLQQTLGPSIKTSSTNHIMFGSINVGGSPMKASSLAFLFDDPDKYYAFPKIKSISPQDVNLAGGEKLRIELEKYIDVGIGGDAFRNDDCINDESTGSGLAYMRNGEFKLLLTGAGLARARFTNSYSGDMPGGVSVGMDIEVDQSIINKPIVDATLFGMELGVDGTVIAIELQSDPNPVNGTYFRVSQTYATSVTSMNKVGVSTSQNKHSISVVRGKSTLSFMINGTEVYKTKIGNGAGRLAVYSTSVLPITATTYITNFKVRPVVIIGENVVTI
jgi:hypothetical protein